MDPRDMIGLPAKIRKAAVLVSSLDVAAADALLGQMDDELAARVRRAAVELGDVSEQERREVMNEFLGKPSPRVVDDAGGIELDGQLAHRLATPASGTYEKPSAARGAEESPPFRFMHEADVSLLLPLIEREHPQTIAVVVAHLPPARAAEVLARLAPESQVEVVRRLIDLEETDPESVREIEQGLESLLSEKLRIVRRRSAGVSAVAAILKAAEGCDRRNLATNLGRLDPRLLGRLNNPPPATGERRRVAAPPAAGSVPRRPERETPPDATNALRSARVAPSPLVGGEDRPPSGDARIAAPPAPAVPAVAFDFDDLNTLSDADLGTVLRAADPEVALLALSGAPRELVDRILARLTRPQAQSLEKRIERLGPLAIRDIDRAQRAVARLAASMAAAGTIDAKGSGGRLAAVA
jgi:flagellar motor switch protein FliG